MAPTFWGSVSWSSMTMTPLRRIGDVLQRHAFQRLDLEGEALMHRAGRQHRGPAPGARSISILWPWARLVALHLGGAVGGGQQAAHALAGRIGQGGQHRMTAPDEIVGVGLGPRRRAGRNQRRPSAWDWGSSRRGRGRSRWTLGARSGPAGAGADLSPKAGFLPDFRSLRSGFLDTIRRPPIWSPEGFRVWRPSKPGDAGHRELLLCRRPKGRRRIGPTVRKRAGGMSRAAKGGDCKSPA